MSRFKMNKSVRYILSIIFITFFISCETDEETSKYDGTWITTFGRIIISDNATKIIVVEAAVPKNKGTSPEMSYGPFTLSAQGAYTSESFDKFHVPDYDKVLNPNQQTVVPQYILAKIEGAYLIVRDSNTSFDDAFGNSDNMFHR